MVLKPSVCSDVIITVVAPVAFTVLFTLCLITAQSHCCQQGPFSTSSSLGQKHGWSLETRAHTDAHMHTHRGGHVNMVLLLLNLKPEAFFLTLNLTYLDILEAEAVRALKQGRTFRTRGGKISYDTKSCCIKNVCS